MAVGVDVHGAGYFRPSKALAHVLDSHCFTVVHQTFVLWPNLASNCNDFHSSSMTPLLSATQVSSYLGISKRSLETLLARGDGPRFLWVGNQRRWAQQELIDWTLQKIGKPEKEGQCLHN